MLKSKIGCYSLFFEYTFPSFKRDKKMHYLPLPKSKQDIRQVPEKVKNYPLPPFPRRGMGAKTFPRIFVDSFWRAHERIPSLLQLSLLPLKATFKKTRKNTVQY